MLSPSWSPSSTNNMSFHDNDCCHLPFLTSKILDLSEYLSSTRSDLEVTISNSSGSILILEISFLDCPASIILTEGSGSSQTCTSTSCRLNITSLSLKLPSKSILGGSELDLREGYTSFEEEAAESSLVIGSNIEIPCVELLCPDDFLDDVSPSVAYVSSLSFLTCNRCCGVFTENIEIFVGCDSELLLSFFFTLSSDLFPAEDIPSDIDENAGDIIGAVIFFYALRILLIIRPLSSDFLIGTS